MKNIELIYREILYKAIEEKVFTLTQSELSKKLNISLSIINSAIKKLNAIGAVKIMQRSFKIFDAKKIIYLFSSLRNLNKDIIFKARIEAPVREIERIMPDVKFSAYSEYKLRYENVPADYSEVYVYSDENTLEIIKKRLKKYKILENSKNPNFFVLKKDRLLDLYPKIPVSQVFADLWNLKEWYAKEFITEIEKQLGA